MKLKDSVTSLKSIAQENRSYFGRPCLMPKSLEVKRRDEPLSFWREAWKFFLDKVSFCAVVCLHNLFRKHLAGDNFVMSANNLFVFFCLCKTFFQYISSSPAAPCACHAIFYEKKMYDLIIRIKIDRHRLF